MTGRDCPAASGDSISQAPGPLHLVQRFAATLRTDPGADLLSGPEDATAWLHATALLPAQARLTNSEHAGLLRLRASLRDVLAAHTGGHEDDDAAARLTKGLADGRLVLTVDPAGAVQLASAARASYPSIVAAIAVAIAEADACGTWRRLKCCITPRCGQIFYDDSTM